MTKKNSKALCISKFTSMQYEILLILEEGVDRLPAIIGELAQKKGMPVSELHIPFFQSLQGLLDNQYIAFDTTGVETGHLVPLQFVDTNPITNEWHFTFATSESSPMTFVTISGRAGDKINIGRVINAITGYSVVSFDVDTTSHRLKYVTASGGMPLVELTDKGLRSLLDLLELRKTT